MNDAGTRALYRAACKEVKALRAALGLIEGAKTLKEAKAMAKVASQL